MGRKSKPIQGKNGGAGASSIQVPSGERRRSMVAGRRAARTDDLEANDVPGRSAVARRAEIPCEVRASGAPGVERRTHHRLDAGAGADPRGDDAGGARGTAAAT